MLVDPVCNVADIIMWYSNIQLRGSQATFMLSSLYLNTFTQRYYAVRIGIDDMVNSQCSWEVLNVNLPIRIFDDLKMDSKIWIWVTGHFTFLTRRVKSNQLPVVTRAKSSHGRNVTRVIATMVPSDLLRFAPNNACQRRALITCSSVAFLRITNRLSSNSPVTVPIRAK